MDFRKQEMDATIAFLKELHALTSKYVKRFERIQKERETQEKAKNFQVDFQGQRELVESLLKNDRFLSFIKQIEMKRGGYKEALLVVGATFPKGRYVTERSFFERVRTFGWKKTLDTYSGNYPEKKEIKWDSKKEEDQIFISNLLDYEIYRNDRKRKPSRAVRVNDLQREKAFELLKEAGLQEVVNLIEEST